MIPPTCSLRGLVRTVASRMGMGLFVTKSPVYWEVLLSIKEPFSVFDDETTYERLLLGGILNHSLVDF